MTMAPTLKPAPKTGAAACDLLNQQIHRAADYQQRQAHIDKHPKHKHQGQPGFFQALTHDGFGVSAKAKFVQHGGKILGA